MTCHGQKLCVAQKATKKLFLESSTFFIKWRTVSGVMWQSGARGSGIESRVGHMSLSKTLSWEVACLRWTTIPFKKQVSSSTKAADYFNDAIWIDNYRPYLRDQCPNHRGLTCLMTESFSQIM
jgi:hypothetical protein